MQRLNVLNGELVLPFKKKTQEGKPGLIKQQL